MPEKSPLLLYGIAPDLATAKSLADDLVAEGCAACVNILPGMHSVYRWEGTIERAEEVVMIIKTTRKKSGAARRLFIERHPHDTPALVALTIDPSASSPAYLDWLTNETTSR
ncbi:MAG: divalent-cation tolerance protein CutA [Pseudomonadota bacterium]